MKRVTFPICAIGILLINALVSCEKGPLNQSRHFSYYPSYSPQNMFVSMDKVTDYVRKISPDTRSMADISVEPLVGQESDTLMYIVNFGRGQGWKILSADVRTPAIIAESEKGAFSLEAGSDGFRLWMEGVKEDLSNIRHSGNEALSFSEKEIAAHMSFWGVEGDSPRALDPPGGLIGGDGYWCERTVSVEEFVTDSVHHLVPKWDQNHPYNEFSPLKVSSTTDRAPTGCVAIAAAQVLWFLHDSLGVPSTIYSQGYCTGDVNSFYREFTNPTDSTWANMSKDYHPSSPRTAEAILIGRVGQIVSMHYDYINTNYFSWTFPSKIRTDVLPTYGISCSHGNYNESIVKNSLSNRMPVIVSATDLMVPTDFEIHCFVIDGFKETYNKYTIYHYWVPDYSGGNPGIEDPELTHPSYYTYSYSSPTVSAVKINWGWSSQWYYYHYNDGWYSLTGDWLTIHPSGSSETWNHNRQMIYGFTVN